MMSLSASRILAVVVLLVAGLLARRWTPDALLDREGLLLDSRWAPVVAGVGTSLIMLWVWGSLRQIPVIHDEIAYLAQARIFSSFHLYAPGRPLPEFFEQYHMFVTPKFMAKYPPGHSLILVPGIWLGIPTLVPLILAGITGAFTFLLARRLTNAWIALTTWLLWTTTPGVLEFMPSYRSEATTSALWLIGWWALLRWRERRERRWLLLLAVSVGLGVLTHPFTWVLFAIPAAAVVTAVVIRYRKWRDLGVAVSVGSVFVVLLFGWNDLTMGNALRFPWSVYAQTYLPADAIGFGVDTAAPLRALPPDMVRFASAIREEHAHYTVARLPGSLLHRLIAIAKSVWGGWRVVLVPCVALGLTAMSAELSFGLLSCLVVVAGYLLYGYGVSSTVYYVELYPVAAFATALGVWRLMNLRATVRESIGVANTRVKSPRAATATLVVCTLLIPMWLTSVPEGRNLLAARARQRVFFRAVTASLPGRRIMVFVKYSPTHDPNSTFIENDPDLARARIWTVHDRGPDDARLIRFAPGRTPYLFDEAAGTIARLNASAVPGPPEFVRMGFGAASPQS